MAKKTAKQTDVALKKAIKNHNAKLTRIEKNIAKGKAPANAMEFLPERRYYKTEKANIHNKSDYMRTLNEIKRFNVKGSEKILKYDGGIQISRYVQKELERKHAKTDEGRKKRHKLVEPLQPESRGEKTGGHLKNEVLQPLKPKKPFDWKHATPADLESYTEVVEKQSSPDFWSKGDDEWINNYIQTLQEEYGISDGDPLIGQIQDCYAEDHLRVVVFMYSDEIGSFTFHYHEDEENRRKGLKATRDTWQRIHDQIFE